MERGAAVITQVPHLYDGGYYYVMPIVVDPIEDGQSPGDVGSFAGAVYRLGYVVFRKIEPIALPEQPVTVGEIAEPSKPWGRLGGR